MIAIINVGGDTDGVCTYHVQINDQFIASFEHNRPDGLVECLLKAADAVDKHRRQQSLDKIVKLCQEMGGYD